MAKSPSAAAAAATAAPAAPSPLVDAAGLPLPPHPAATQPAPRVPAMDASGQHTPDAPPLPGVTLAEATLARLDATGAEELELMGLRQSPPLTSARPAPLPGVQLFGTKSSPAPEAPLAAAAFDRVGMIEALLTHPMAEVRQRAAEAKVAIHHGAADIGIKMRAAIDTARAAETRR